MKHIQGRAQHRFLTKYEMREQRFSLRSLHSVSATGLRTMALALLCALVAGSAVPVFAGRITTYAGGPGRGKATDFGQFPYSVAVKGDGVYISDQSNHVVRLFHEKSGIENVAAGDLAIGDGGDGGPAIKAELTNGLSGVAADPAGNLYIAETGFSDGGGGNRIRKVDSSGIITTVAGTGVAGYSGDGGPATLAQLNGPYDVAADSAGNIYIADTYNGVVRKVDSSGIITTVATGFYFVSGVAVDLAGNLLIADQDKHSIFKLNTRTGNLKTVAGDGTYGYGGDGGPATKAQLSYPYDIGVDFKGNFYIADTSNHVIRKVDASGVITTVAGTGTAGFSGDGGPATKAELFGPRAVGADAQGRLYIADGNNYRVRSVSPSGVIHTIAGNGQYSGGPDGSPATQVELGFGEGLAFSHDGSLYTTPNSRVRKISPAGVVTTVAGTEVPGYSGDGGPAISAQLNGPRDIAFDAAGNYYVADSDNNAIRKVNTAGIITTVAGTGVAGFSGDGGPATSAQISRPYALEISPAGTLYIADTGNSCVREVTKAGIIRTVAGIGRLFANAGDGGPATKARLGAPEGIAFDTQGNYYIGDFGFGTVRKVNKAGIISTFAGTGVPGFSGDGGPATAAQLLTASGLIVDAAGNLYITDTFNHRVRKVNTAGIIHTIAGTGPTGNSQGGFRGDGGPATSALLNGPDGLTLDSAGNLYFSDLFNQRIRRVENP